MLDLEGLQIAFLGSALAHYLDLETGDIVDLPLEAEAPDASRFLRIPSRTPESEEEDRRLFVEQVKASPAVRERLGQAHDALSFRRVLSEDRTIEKAWFNFKNEQATRAIETWLRKEGITPA
jgi:hypothetical protein